MGTKRFVMCTEKCGVVDSYVQETHERLSTPTKATLLLSGQVKRVEFGDEYWVMVRLNTLMPPFYWIFPVFGVGLSLVFGSIKPFFISIIPFLLFAFFELSFLYMIMIRIGLRKKGYKGKIILLG